MKKRFGILAMTLIVALSASVAFAGGECIELGWKGGAVGNQVKWVKGDLVERGTIATINYNWKNGTMTGRVNNGVYKGTWVQDGSRGGSFYFKVPNSSTNVLTGWWSSKGNTKKHPLLVRLCQQ